MLMGEFHHSIDDKGRLIIPSKLRSELGVEAVITRGLDKCLFIYSKEEWTKIASELKTLPFTKTAARNVSRFFLSGASTTLFDKQGRINIPAPLTSYANLTKDCVIIGVNERVEVWDKEAFDAFMIENMDSFAEMAEDLFAGGM